MGLGCMPTWATDPYVQLLPMAKEITQIPVDCLVRIFSDANLPVEGTWISFTPTEDGLLIKFHRDEGDYIYECYANEEGLAVDYAGFSSNTPYQA